MVLLLLLTVSAISVCGLCLLSSAIVNSDIERRQITNNKVALKKFLALCAALVWLDLFLLVRVAGWLNLL